jgi:hypothetical protein
MVVVVTSLITLCNDQHLCNARSSALLAHVQLCEALVLDKAPDVAADRPQAALPVYSTLTVYNYSIL